jgi:hypothetical protein
MILSGEALVEFRSSERRCVWRVSQVYKHLTAIGVKTQSSYELSSILHYRFQKTHRLELHGVCTAT